jgi:hypothetical protein
MNRSLLPLLVLSVSVLSAALGGCAADTSDPVPQGQEEEAAPTEVSEPEVVALSYANVGPIVTASCGGCHAPFRTLAGIKANKANMLAATKSGFMPRGNPGFKATADGKKVLSWLKSGKDLK